MRDRPTSSVLLLIDFQARLMPAIHDGRAALANAGRLAAAARVLGIPVIGTEQNPAGLGGTLPELAGALDSVFVKKTFDATREPAWAGFFPPGRSDVFLAGCEAHVCVLQTAMGLMNSGAKVRIVSDACGARTSSNHSAALDRLSRAGAEIVTTEMVIFEWLGSSEHPHFREVLGLIK